MSNDQAMQRQSRPARTPCYIFVNSIPKSVLPLIALYNAIVDLYPWMTDLTSSISLSVDCKPKQICLTKDLSILKEPEFGLIILTSPSYCQGGLFAVSTTFSSSVIRYLCETGKFGARFLNHSVRVS